jgi:hypothetical protein
MKLHNPTVTQGFYPMQWLLKPEKLTYRVSRGDRRENCGVLCRIERGGVKIEGHPPYDGYVQVGKSHATLEQALEAGRRQIAADQLRSRDPFEHTTAGAARHFCDAS